MTFLVSKAYPDIHGVVDFAGEIAAESAGRMIRDLSAVKKKSVASLTSRAISQGWSDEMLAERIAGVVGLGERETRAVENFRQKMLDDGMPKNVVRQRVAEYRRRAKAQRARLIAQSEVAQCLAQAQRVLWAQQRGGPEVSLYAVRVTRSNRDDRLCDRCRRENGTRRSLKTTQGGPPFHPGCRCTEVLEDQGILTKAAPEPKDGDGDGFVYDGTPRMRPARPRPAKRARAWKPERPKAKHSRAELPFKRILQEKGESGNVKFVSTSTKGEVKANNNALILDNIEFTPELNETIDKIFDDSIEKMLIYFNRYRMEQLDRDEEGYAKSLEANKKSLTPEGIKAYLDDERTVIKELQESIATNQKKLADADDASKFLAEFDILRERLGRDRRSLLKRIADLESGETESKHIAVNTSYLEINQERLDNIRVKKERIRSMTHDDVKALIVGDIDNMVSGSQIPVRIRRSIEEWLDGIRSKPDATDASDEDLRSEYMKMEIRGAIDQWASTSMDSSSEAIALQYSAYTLFGVGNLDSVEDSDLDKGIDEYRDKQHVYDAIVDAAYNATQKRLKEEGITELKLWRGMFFRRGGDSGAPEPPEWTPSPQMSEVREFTLAPLSSWSVNYETSAEFAHISGNHMEYDTDVPIMLSVIVPAENIFSSAFTGFGCFHEEEYVLLGWDSEVNVTSHEVLVASPANKWAAITIFSNMKEKPPAYWDNITVKQYNEQFNTWFDKVISPKSKKDTTAIKALKDELQDLIQDEDIGIIEEQTLAVLATKHGILLQAFDTEGAPIHPSAGSSPVSEMTVTDVSQIIGEKFMTDDKLLYNFRSAKKFFDKYFTFDTEDTLETVAEDLARKFAEGVDVFDPDWFLGYIKQVDKEFGETIVYKGVDY